MKSKVIGADADEQALLATRLLTRRRSILQRWHRAVAAEPDISAADSLSRRQFVDHIPEVLQAFHDALVGAARKDAPVEPARIHGLHRWQQGYSLLEVVREWQLLHQAVLDEIELATYDLPGLRLSTVNAAYRSIARLCLGATHGSVAEYERLRRAEAQVQVHDLERELQQSRDFELQQAELLRGVAHDLRGGMNIVSTATAALLLEQMAPERRAELVAVTQRAIVGQTRLLSDLLDLARLQAGLEQRALQPIDASALLNEICRTARPLADQRGLYLHCDGAANLLVTTDPVKLARIVQNLLLNALRYTVHGGVDVAWRHGAEGDAARWHIDVRDTGPGIASSPLTHAFAEATAEARDDEDLSAANGTAVPVSPERPPESGPRREGIGLSIVKRLCELLDATLSMESAPGQGTAFRISLPLTYDAKH
jgi:signal transduction histidine kinase